MQGRPMLPEPARVEYRPGVFKPVPEALAIRCSSAAHGLRVAAMLGMGESSVIVTPLAEGALEFIQVGPVADCHTIHPAAEVPDHQQGYYLSIDQEAFSIVSHSGQGLFYGCMTLLQLVSKEGFLPALTIVDQPVLDQRGIMVDISRGRVFTLQYLKDLVVAMAKLKLNVLQLYIEHTFAFSNLREVHRGADPIDALEIRELDCWCRLHYVQLQPNLQSFGHCNRLLTTKGWRHLRESDLYWTLSPAEEGSYRLLAEMYAEFLPNFSSTLFNIDSDETYDLGSLKSAALMAQMGKGPLYLHHLLRLRELAAKHGKTLMVFGDVILHHPELLNQIPDDIVFLDWIYDPQDSYPSVAKFGQAGKRFWVCPGTGAWNTLFPRQDGAVRNIMGLVLEGVRQGAEGMLLCDWGDHGSYTLPAFSRFAYAVAAQAAWKGSELSLDELSKRYASTTGEEALDALHRILPRIHRLPAMWSKNRSQCAIALFDEPLMGRMLTAAEPPAELVALKPLPATVKGVLDAESHHLMRPLFRMEVETVRQIKAISTECRPLVAALHDQSLQSQYRWLLDALDVLSDKISLGRAIRSHFASATLDADMLLDWEQELRLLIGRYVGLQMDFVDIWRSVAKRSEIAIALSYFAHIVERLDYLKGWLGRQRLAIQTNHEVDYAMATYQTAGYLSLPTY